MQEMKEEYEVLLEEYNKVKSSLAVMEENENFFKQQQANLDITRGASIAGLGLDMSRSRLDSSASYMRESVRQTKPVQDFNRQFSAIE